MQMISRVTGVEMTILTNFSQISQGYISLAETTILQNCSQVKSVLGNSCQYVDDVKDFYENYIMS